MYIKKHGEKWRVIVQHGGFKRSAVEATRARAQMKGAQMLEELGGTRPHGNVTVGELLDTWMGEAKLSIKYRADVISALRFVPLAFHERDLRSVETSVVNSMYRGLTKAGVSGHRVKRIHGAMSSAWGHAIGEGWALSNPFTGAKIPPVEPAKVTPPAPDVVNTILAALEERPQLHLFILLSATLGGRRGETMALQWDDITPNAVMIRRSITQIPGETQISNTKTGLKGHRSVAIGPKAAVLLEQEHTRQITLAKRAGLPRPVWVFDNHDAGQSHRRPDYWTQSFVKLRRQLGVTGVRLHDVRHYVATQLLTDGVDPATVAHRLGHSSVSTTLRVYSGWVQASDQRSAATMERLLG